MGRSTQSHGAIGGVCRQPDARDYEYDQDDEPGLEPLHATGSLLGQTPGAKHVRRMELHDGTIERDVRGRPGVRRESEKVPHALDPRITRPGRRQPMNQSTRRRLVLLGQPGIRQLEYRPFTGLENEQQADVDYPSRRVQARSARYGKELFVPVHAGKPLGEQDPRVASRGTFLQQLGRYARRKTIGAELRIENLSERQERLTVARKNFVALITIRKNPIDAHGVYAAFLRFTVSCSAEYTDRRTSLIASV
jgi:hypothetical protein